MNFELSEYQKKIKTYFVMNPHNNMAIEALAGCGKTATALMLTNLTKSSDVYIAFNKSIQMEMKEKLTNPKTKCFTMHGLALSVMNYNLGLIHKKCVLDNYKIFKYVEDLFKSEYKNKKNNTLEMKTFLQENYSTVYNLIRLKCIEINADNIEYMLNDMGLFQAVNNCFAPSIGEIVDWLEKIDSMSLRDFEEKNICDFTDMLYITLNKLQNKEWQIPYWMLYTNIYADEAQDLSQIQLRLLKYFKRTGGRYVFIYDQNQAIYGFAGADCKSYEKIHKIFTPIEKFKLPINYRCGSKILDYTNSKFHVGILPRPNANEGAVHTILESQISEYIKPNDFMIGRTNQQLISIGLSLVKENIRIYLEDKEIVTTLVKYIQSLKMTTVDEIKIYCMDLIEAYGQMNAMERAQYKYETVENAIMSLSLINNFQNFSQSKATNKLIAYIEDIINTTNPTDCVRIMSIHKSKGLESDNVFVLNEAEPFVKLARSKDMIQQEKNLSYVAITRAKNNLYLVKGVVE